MAELNKIIGFLNQTLKINEIQDSSNNGLQVGENKNVKKIAFAVDSKIDSFKKAKKENCGLIITHHGISWNDSLKYLTGLNFKRVSYLMKNDLALATYHLPLDKHDKLGHNVSLMKMFGIKTMKPFEVGYFGKLPKKASTKTLAKFLEKKLDTKCVVYEYGKKLNSSISIVSGGAGRMVESASKLSDCFITGEGSYSNEHVAKEMKTNMILAGHYETEVIGLKNLMTVLKRKFKVEVVFV